MSHIDDNNILTNDSNLLWRDQVCKKKYLGDGVEATNPSKSRVVIT